jgi:hypothetical protein
MLRNAVTALGGLLILIGVICLAAEPGAFPAWLWLMGAGTLVLLGTLYERVVYKPLETAVPGAGWVRTTERFVDDTSGRPVTVYIEPTTGERKYVED